MTLKRYKNPDGTLAFTDDAGGNLVTGGEVHVDATQLTDAQYATEVAALAAAVEASRLASIAALTAVLPTHVKLYRYMPNANDGHHNKNEPPFSTDYVTGVEGRLNPTNATVVKGEIRRIDYYANATAPDPVTGAVAYSDLIVREEFAYTRDSIGFARARTQTITWYREDGTAHPTVKTRLKYYEPQDSMIEGQRRRRNITDKTMMEVTNWLVATQTQLTSVQARIDLGRDFMKYHKTNFDMFIDASSKQVWYDVRDSGIVLHPWLSSNYSTGLTVRKKIQDDINIWGLS